MIEHIITSTVLILFILLLSCSIVGCTFGHSVDGVHTASSEKHVETEDVDMADVDETGGDGSLNAESTYTDWQWILTRSNKGAWTLQTWGYKFHIDKHQCVAYTNI